MRYYRTFVILLICVVLLTGCLQIAQTIPDNGLWNCKELQITIDLESGQCFAIIDNTKINCAFCNDRGSEYVSVLCQDPKNKNYHLGESVFEGICIYYDEDIMIIREELTQIVYTFYRQDSETALSHEKRQRTILLLGRAPIGGRGDGSPVPCPTKEFSSPGALPERTG